VVEESADQFAFRHAPTQQAIYTQLLVRERRVLHRMIGEAMEQLYSTTLETHQADLAYHFHESGAWEKALEYAQHAGENAQHLYAPRTAVEQFTRALEAAHHLALAPSPPLYRARGQAYETLGEFDQARADYEQAREAAHTRQDGAGEWQSLLDLGFLWLGRDYERAGVFFRRALELAQRLADPKLHAQSLNRLGNWYTHAEQPSEALHYHQEALATFRKLNDLHGIAETLDLLGVTYGFSGDLVQSATYCKQAVELFRELDERQGLVSNLAALIIRGGCYNTVTQVPVPMSLSEVLQVGEQALKLAREIGQRSAEAFVLFIWGLCLGLRGAYAQALECAQASLTIAEEINHRQWMVGAHLTLGVLYLDLLALALAHSHLEQVLALAHEIGSLWWIRNASAFLAAVSIRQHDLAQAESLLTTACGLDTPAQTQMQRLVWYMHAELALGKRSRCCTRQRKLRLRCKPHERER
jgi:tetratricopeptide (TPR) repeat protein